MIRLVFCVVSFSIALFAFQPSKDRVISKDALKITSSMLEGDVLLIYSNDFFSRFVRSLDNCKQSSFKLVVNHENAIYLLVSDANDISDNTQGLRLEEPINYLNSYGSLHIKHLRPKEMTDDARDHIRRYIQRSQKELVSYDFSFFKNTQEKLTCEKIVYTVHPQSFSLKNVEDPWLMTFLPCDFKEEEFVALSGWTNFFSE